MGEIVLFTAKIDTWADPLTIRAFNEHDAEGLTRALFKVPTEVKVTVTKGTEEVDAIEPVLRHDKREDNMNCPNCGKELIERPDEKDWGRMYCPKCEEKIA